MYYHHNPHSLSRDLGSFLGFIGGFLILGAAAAVAAVVFVLVAGVRLTARLIRSAAR